MYEIFKDSMYSKIQAAGILGILFVCMSAYYYEVLIVDYVEVSENLNKINQLRDSMLISSDLNLINNNLSQIDMLYDGIKDKLDVLMGSFTAVTVVCYLNLTFFVQHVITSIFTFKLGRFYVFPSLVHVTDTILAACSIYIIVWIKMNISKNLDEGLIPK